MIRLFSGEVCRDEMQFNIIFFPPQGLPVEVRCSAFDVRRLLSGQLWPYSPSPMSILISILLGFLVLVALMMILVILMQRPKSEGLGAAFGGAVTENLFGAQTTNVLVKFTAWLAGIFFTVTFFLSILYAHRSLGGSSLSRELKKTAPAAQVSPAPAASAAPGISPAGSTSPAGSVAPAVSGSVAPNSSPVSAGSASPRR
jgi:preprotein translocase subunit SecG